MIPAIQHMQLHLRSYGAISDTALEQFIKSVHKGIKHLQDAMTVEIQITDQIKLSKGRRCLVTRKEKVDWMAR